MAYIEFKDVNKSFGDNHVLKNINLSVEKDSFVTLLGSSGCGKTTLLRSFAGLEGIEGGKIMLGGEDITNKHPRERNVSMIFQHYSLFPTMTVYNNIAYGLKIKKLSKDKIKEEVKAALEAVELLDKMKSYPSQLSGGEQQRVAIARSIVTRPKVLLLDEPFNAIDAKLRKELQLKIKEIHKKYGMTSIMVTHDQDEAMTMSDTIHFFKNGNIEQSGSPLDLYMNPRTSYVASFMGNYNIYQPEIFSKITSGKYSGSKTTAFRPEALSISDINKEKAQGEVYNFSGEILDIIPQQNVARFIVGVGDSKIFADTIIDQLSKFKKGQMVNLSIGKNKILYY
ncbi:MAG: transporter, ATP-binding protein [Clostridiales bacterium]|jgi:putative spermidine/putrescine transport system ATP-binding protein|nr:transporter, ATP-binding protein [Clostridiales bacterium]